MQKKESSAKYHEITNELNRNATRNKGKKAQTFVLKQLKKHYYIKNVMEKRHAHTH